MTTPPFGRVLTAMVTPMTPDGAVDEDGVRAVADHLLAQRHDGLIVNGTTGESATLTSDESIRVIEIVAGHVGDRAQIVAGVGSNDTVHSVEMARRAAAAWLVATAAICASLTLAASTPEDAFIAASTDTLNAIYAEADASGGFHMLTDEDIDRGAALADKLIGNQPQTRTPANWPGSLPTDTSEGFNHD